MTNENRCVLYTDCKNYGKIQNGDLCHINIKILTFVEKHRKKTKCYTNRPMLQETLSAIVTRTTHFPKWYNFDSAETHLHYRHLRLSTFLSPHIHKIGQESIKYR